MTSFYTNVQQAPFLYLNDHPNQYYEKITTSLNQGTSELDKIGIDASFIVRDTFFSPRNVDIIQKWLIAYIMEQTGITIPYQNEQHVKQAMAGIFQAYAQNLPLLLKEQIKELDLKVVKTLSNAIITELYARTRFLNKLESANYMDRPIFVGAKGQRTLPSTQCAL